MNVIFIIIAYVVLINIIGFAIMGIDKYKSKKRLWRIPEATLFIVAIIGGSIGTILGMFLFRHKTRHWYFLYGMPAIFLLQIAILIAILQLPIQFTIM